MVLVSFILSFYRAAVSPFVGPRCRYVPSCSEYMRDAIREDGLWKGGLAGIFRILRCAPWAGAGFDPYVAHKHEPGQ